MKDPVMRVVLPVSVALALTAAPALAQASATDASGASVSEAAADSGQLIVDEKVVVSPDPAPAVPYNTPAPAKK